MFFGQIGAISRDKLAMCLYFQSWVWICLGDLDKAAACVQEREQILEEIGDIWNNKNVPTGDLAYKRGDYEHARIAFENEIELILSNEIQPGSNIADLSRKLGDAYRAQHKYRQALASYRISLEQSRAYPETWNMVWIACCFAFTEIDLANTLPSIESNFHYLCAARILGFGEAFKEKQDLITPVEYQPEYERGLCTLREQLNPASLEAAWAEGRAMTNKQAVVYMMQLEG